MGWNMRIRCIAVMILMLTSTYAVIATTEAQWQPNRYYAGYSYYGHSVATKNIIGISGKIYTINPGVPEGEFVAEWVTIITSYYAKFWVQVGYVKRVINGRVEVLWYFEERDPFYCPINQYCWVIVWYDAGPAPDSWHTYKIRREKIQLPDGYMWRWAAFVDWRKRGLPTEAPRGEDMQAMVETSTTAINIGGSHFKALHKWELGSSWTLWDRHTARADDPYYVTEVAHWEFYAGGGG